MLVLNVKSHNATNIIRNSRDLRQINSGKDNYALMSNHYEFKIRSSMSIYRKMKARNTWLSKLPRNKYNSKFNKRQVNSALVMSFL